MSPEYYFYIRKNSTEHIIACGTLSSNSSKLESCYINIGIS